MLNFHNKLSRKKIREYKQCIFFKLIRSLIFLTIYSKNVIKIYVFQLQNCCRSIIVGQFKNIQLLSYYDLRVNNLRYTKQLYTQDTTHWTLFENLNIFA